MSARTLRFATFVVLLLLGALAPAQAPPAAGSADELQKQGDALREQRDYAGALQRYRAAAAKTPNDSHLWNKIGMMSLQLSQLRDAQRGFERAVKINRNYAEAYNNLGVVFYLRKEYKKAIKNYQKAIAVQELAASFHNNLAAAYFARKEIPQAMKEYARAYQLDPEIFERTGRGGEAFQTRSPEDRALYAYLLAKVYAKSGDRDSSLRYLKRAMEEGYKDIKKVYTDEEFADLRQDPRFAELMKHEPTPLPPK